MSMKIAIRVTEKKTNQKNNNTPCASKIKTLCKLKTKSFPVIIKIVCKYMYFSLYTSFGKQKIQKVFFFYLMRYTHTVYREKLRALIYCPRKIIITGLFLLLLCPILMVYYQHSDYYLMQYYYHFHFQTQQAFCLLILLILYDC